MTKLRIALVSFLVFLGIVAADVNFNESRAVLKAVASASFANATLSNPTFTGTVTVGDGSAATQVIASNLSGAIDPTITYGNGFIDFTYGAVTSRFNSSSWNLFGNTASINLGSSSDVQIIRGGTNQLVFAAAGSTAGAATSRAEINKAVTAFSNNVAKTVFTITIPNAAHSASIEIQCTGSLGAGGAIGANEASATNKYVITVTRTAGVNAVAAISSAYGAAASAVAGAATVTAVATLAAVSGAVGATNTIDIQLTIARSGGSSDNHTAVCYAKLLNANATGVTIA